jgi:hypothetical protein
MSYPLTASSKEFINDFISGCFLKNFNCGLKKDQNRDTFSWYPSPNMGGTILPIYFSISINSPPLHLEKKKI